MVVFHEELVHFGGVHGYSGLAKDFIKFFELEGGSSGPCPSRSFNWFSKYLY